MEAIYYSIIDRDKRRQVYPYTEYEEPNLENDRSDSEEPRVK